MNFLIRKSQYLMSVLFFITIAPRASADEPALKNIIASQQALIAKQQQMLVSLQKQVETNQEALTKLTKQVIVDGKVVADRAAYATSADSAKKAVSAASAEESNFCNRLRGEDNGHTVGVTWEGSTLYFNVDNVPKIKGL